MKLSQYIELKGKTYEGICRHCGNPVSRNRGMWVEKEVYHINCYRDHRKIIQQHLQGEL